MPDVVPQAPPQAEGPGPNRAKKTAVTLGALGVVYGDIGTSPLYAFSASLRLTTDGTPTSAEVLGILSLITWALLIVVSLKYLALVLRADNQGEGGVLALLALALGRRADQSGGSSRGWLLALGMAGAALLYGDGIITPAISVLSAVEGLGLITDRLDAWVVPITVLILIGLFSLQSRGTGRIARLFGPAMALWFATIGLLGLPAILRQPQVLWAFDPRCAIDLMASHPLGVLATLTGVVLAITGAEALYADLGHFGRRPIQRGWYLIVLPALLLNYFGQGALSLESGSLGKNPFFDLAPRSFQLPLVLLATVATVIASQALISAAFSLTQQAVQLRLLPRLRVVHTSQQTRGRIYLASVNMTLALLSIAVVVGFKSSAAIASAYGIAVTGTMVATTLLFARVAHTRLNWPRAIIFLIVPFLLAVDLAFFVANLEKIDSGGFVPLAIAVLVFLTMDTWNRGWQVLDRHLSTRQSTLDTAIDEASANPTLRIPGTAVYLTSNLNSPPLALLSDLRVGRVLHQQVVLLSIVPIDQPRVRPEDRATLRRLRSGFVRVAMRVGFTENLKFGDLVLFCRANGLALPDDDTWYFVSRLTVAPGQALTLQKWRGRFFGMLLRNASSLVDALEIPEGRFVELRIRVNI